MHHSSSNNSNNNMHNINATQAPNLQTGNLQIENPMSSTYDEILGGIYIGAESKVIDSGPDEEFDKVLKLKREIAQEF